VLQAAPGRLSPVYIITSLVETNLRIFFGTNIVGLCGVMGSTLAFGLIGHGFESEHRLFAHHSLQSSKITGIVLTGRFSSLPAVVHSASYSQRKANRLAAYQWLCCGVNTGEQKSFAYTGSSFPIRYVNY